MNNENFLVNFILSMPVWVKAALLLAIAFFILWPVFSGIIARLLAFIVAIVQTVFRLVYFLFGWVLLDALHRKFGGVFAAANLQFTQAMGNIDTLFIKLRKEIIKLEDYKVSVAGTLIYAALVLVFMAPDLFHLNDKSPLYQPKQTYYTMEKQVFGVSDQLQITLNGLKVLEEPFLKSDTLQVLKRGEIVISCFKTKTVNDVTFVKVKTLSGNKGWIISKYAVPIEEVELV